MSNQEKSVMVCLSRKEIQTILSWFDGDEYSTVLDEIEKTLLNKLREKLNYI